MGALYEDVEQFFGDIFAWYGRQVARFPWVFIIIPVLVCCLLGLGLFSLSYETEIEVLYTPIGSQASIDQDYLLRMFPDMTADNFYIHQQLTQPTFAEVIIVVKSDDDDDTCQNNITSTDILNEIQMLYDVIFNLTVQGDDEDSVYSYSDVCATRDDKCFVDGSIFLENMTDIWISKMFPELSDLLLVRTDHTKGMC